MQDNPQAIVELVGVTRIHKASEAMFELVVDDLRVNRGEFVALVGSSGCGKSTLLDMLALVLRPTECKTFRLFNLQKNELHDIKDRWAAGDENTLARIRSRSLGYVLQTGGLLRFLTARQNIYLPLKQNGLMNLAPAADELIKQMGIDHRVSHKPHKLSGGERQRVAILRAIVHRPPLILADEPTAAVDKERAIRIVTQFRDMAKAAGTAVIMVTHDRNLVKDIADATYTFELTPVTPTHVRSRCYSMTES